MSQPKLAVIEFNDAPQELRGDIVKTLHDHWEDAYEKYARIFTEDDLSAFLDRQYSVPIFVDRSEISTSPANIPPKFLGTVTISNDIGQPSLGFKAFWISNLYVIETYRNKGLGSYILRYTEDYLKKMGITYVALTADDDKLHKNPCNTKICNFYKRHGYKQIGFHPASGNPIFMKSLA
jgi:GNAT superfamily N-acetyltransferase